METKNKNINNIREFRSIIIGKLMTISGILQRETNKLLLPYQLNQQQFSILFEIAKAKDVNQKNMVNRLLLEKAHVSKVVKKLQIMGLIEIIPAQNDKRSAKLVPTQKGQKLISECQSVFYKWNKEWFNQFSEKELLQILKNVDKLQKAFISKYSK